MWLYTRQVTFSSLSPFGCRTKISLAFQDALHIPCYFQPWPRCVLPLFIPANMHSFQLPPRAVCPWFDVPCIFFPSELSQGCPILSPFTPAHFLAGIIALFLFLLDILLIESLTLLGRFSLPAIPPYDPPYQSLLERITSAWYSSISSTSLSSGKHDGF